MEHEILVMGNRSQCVLVDYVKGIYYARFHHSSYHKYREIHYKFYLALSSDKVNGA